MDGAHRGIDLAVQFVQLARAKKGGGGKGKRKYAKTSLRIGGSPAGTQRALPSGVNFDAVDLSGGTEAMMVDNFAVANIHGGNVLHLFCRQFKVENA